MADRLRYWVWRHVKKSASKRAMPIAGCEPVRTRRRWSALGCKTTMPTDEATNRAGSRLASTPRSTIRYRVVHVVATRLNHGLGRFVLSELGATYHALQYDELTRLVRASIRESRGNAWLFRSGSLWEYPLRLRRELTKPDASTGYSRSCATKHRCAWISAIAAGRTFSFWRWSSLNSPASSIFQSIYKSRMVPRQHTGQHRLRSPARCGSLMNR